jgi:hypothetical protein
LLKMLVAFKSVPELIEVVYATMGKYLECAVDESCQMRCRSNKVESTPPRMMANSREAE